MSSQFFKMNEKEKGEFNNKKFKTEKTILGSPKSQNDSKISFDDNLHDQETENNCSQSKRIEKILFQEFYQKTIERGYINMASKDDMEVMINAMKKKVKSSKEKTFIISAISQIGVFAHHPMIFKEESVTTQLFREIRIEQFSKRQTIFKQGDIGDTYYMIIKGEVFCLIPTSNNQEKLDDSFAKKKKRKNRQQTNSSQNTIDFESEERMFHLNDEEFLQNKFPTFKNVKTFKQWEGFGDIALITQQYRTATMVCKDDAYMITMTKSGFDKIIGELSRQQKITQVKFLKQFPFFCSIPKSKLMSILMDIEVMKYSKNKVLYEEGQPITHVFFILEGEIEVYKKLSVEFKRGNIIEEYEKEMSQESTMSRTLSQKNTVSNIRHIGLSIIGSNSYCGVDELFNGKIVRENSAKCISPSSIIYVLSKDKFLDSLKVNKQLERDNSPCIEKDNRMQERAQIMTSHIQESLHKINNNISLSQKQKIHDQSEKRIKPLTNPRDIIKERIILNKEIVPDRMIKYSNSINLNY